VFRDVFETAVKDGEPNPLLKAEALQAAVRERALLKHKKAFMNRAVFHEYLKEY